ncbi:DUF6531 domain-containing protein [Streptomyces sp. E5N298]|uniref:DUF6531 domain-containing protein n=1 Tax=Streptomyces sp. E5N298 TaxID=1851983 RepID=UPI00187D1B58|nr:DUF6531 domain-containing protein [Streptomyces sp. E5N298]
MLIGPSGRGSCEAAALVAGGPILGGLAKGMKGMATAVRGGLKTLRSGAKDLLAKAKPYKGRCRGGDPIDMVSGEMLMEQVDLELGGLLPLVVRRTHVSTYRWGSCFGAKGPGYRGSAQEGEATARSSRRQA